MTGQIDPLAIIFQRNLFHRFKQKGSHSKSLSFLAMDRLEWNKALFLTDLDLQPWKRGIDQIAPGLTGPS